MDAAAIRSTRFQALLAELGAIRAFDQPVAGESELHDVAHRLGLSALCLSGGGIRSAAFCLGVLQALARAKLLVQFDYLSTVSGGGYIGGWLQGMIHRRGSPNAAEAALGDLDDPPMELRALRNYTSYLTPQAGLFSTDTWTAVVLYLRNVLLNWVVYLPILLLPVLLAILYRTTIWAVGGHVRLQLALIGAAAVCAAVGTFFVARELPDHRPRDADGINYASTRAIAVWACLPIFGWAALAPLSQGLGDEHSPLPPLWPLLIAYWIALTVGYCAAWLASWLLDHEARLFGRNSVAFGGASVVSTAMIGAGIALARLVPPGEQAQALAVLGPLWLLLATGIHSAVFVGLRRDSLLFDLDREWLARVSALKLRAGALWTAVAFCSLSLTWLLHQPASPPTWVAAIVTLATGSVGAWIGKQASSQVGAVLTAISRSQQLRTLALNVLAAVFIAGLIAVLGMVADAGLGQVQDLTADHVLGLRPQRAGSWQDVESVQVYQVPPWLLFVVQAVAALALIIVIVWATRRVNVNRYSMHAVFRNRLTRAFLGAARGSARRPDPFTDFDPDDNLPLAALGDLLCQRRLFPVINLTLNLTSGGAAAWAERKAMAFTATPLACGAPLLPIPGAPAGRGADPSGAYATTALYAGLENPGADAANARGLSLATAMTISGATVSPNWGYHSSTMTAFVMTLFNVRLGAWLPNPAVASSAEELNLARPPHSLRAMLGDLLGVAGESAPAIYLSDGGHFDNLGLYEMLRRRCRLILVIDAGEDPACSFEDLGNALRKSAIDMQVTVEFDAVPRIAARTDTAAAATALGYAVGTIRYPEKPAEPGHLVYLKPSLLTEIPADVRAYANLHEAFPHEPTLDQFFTESQFESYRALGEFQMERLVGGTPDGDLPALFATASRAYEGPESELDTL